MLLYNNFTGTDQTSQCDEDAMCFNGQTCLTADFDFNCMRSNRTCENPTPTTPTDEGEGNID